MLKEDFEFYLNNQAELVKKYNGKYLAIKDKKVIGVYASEFEAVTQTQKNYELGTFLIQKCTPGSDSVTSTFHSRFSFA